MLYPQNAVIILYETRFPENIGSVARACANMGCEWIRLVNPERNNLLQAWPLATRIGQPVLNKIRIFDNLHDAVKDLTVLFGTSARLGERRKSITPAQFATLYLESDFSRGDLFGILFGPEDRGLSNKELSLCKNIIHIPCAQKASSLNISQAALIILYELFKNTVEKPKNDYARPVIKIEDLSRLEDELKELLINISCLPEKNPDYFFSQWHDMLVRREIRRNEYDAFMGMFRQIKNYLKRQNQV